MPRRLITAVTASRTRLALPALLVAALIACDSRAEPAAGTQPRFDRAPWHDGNAEVNFYEAVEFRYGEPRQADEAVLIFVKEDHLRDEQIKADNPRDADLPAVKLNWVVQIPTGIYTYRQQASVFIDRETNLPFRQTFASHEWCGNVYKDLRRADDGGFTYSWSSYFEEDGDGETRVSRPGGDVPLLPADALPLYVRTAAEDHTIAVLPSLRSIRAEADDFQPARATLRLGDTESINVPAGEFDARRVTIDYADGRQDIFHLETADPRLILKMELSDGATYELRLSRRIDYWNRNAPADDTLREGAGLH